MNFGELGRVFDPLRTFTYEVKNIDGHVFNYKLYKNGAIEVLARDGKKLTVFERHYYPAGSKDTLAFRLRSNQVVPPKKYTAEFHAGGAGTVRKTVGGSNAARAQAQGYQNAPGYQTGAGYSAGQGAGGQQVQQAGGGGMQTQDAGAPMLAQPTTTSPWLWVGGGALALGAVYLVTRKGKDKDHKRQEH